MDKVHFVVSKAAAGTKGLDFYTSNSPAVLPHVRMKQLLHSQPSVAIPRTRWPTSTTGNTSRTGRCLATKSWPRTALTSWNSLFCWTTITSNRNTSMWRSLTCECAWQQQINHQIPPPNMQKFTKPFQLHSGRDIDMFPKSTNMGVKVNGMEIPVENLPYQHPTGFCRSFSNSHIFKLIWHIGICICLWPVERINTALLYPSS